jgi:trimethylguanosine synthase
MTELDKCPFGEDLQKYWDKRHEYFSLWDEGIKTDAEGLYSVIPEVVADKQAGLIHGEYVLDGFAGIGGSAIALARAGKKVISIEKSCARYSMAKHNAAIYGVIDEITFINGDFFETTDPLAVDTINLDPPWGGPEYKKHGRFLLEHFAPEGEELLHFSLKHADEVVLRVPTIFDMSELDRFDANIEVSPDISNGSIVSKTVILRK